MFKKSILALAAASSVMAVAVPTPAEARHKRHHVSRVYRGTNASYRCRRGDGTLGTVIGAVAGAGAGMLIDRHGAAPYVGAVGGGLAGRSIAHHQVRCR